MADDLILIDEPAPYVRRVTLNRPEKRNAISNALRSEFLAALQAADTDESVRVSIVRGSGTCFSSGYDLKSDLGADQPYFTADVGTQFSRHIAEGFLSVWDLAKPVIAQVHGYAMAGGLELASSCDLVYIADDAKLSHPVVKFAGLPDFAPFPFLALMRNAMELHLTGRQFTAQEAVSMGLANRAFPAEELDERVLEIAVEIAQTNAAVLSVNKRYVHAAMEAMGARSVIRTAPDLQAGAKLDAARGDIGNLTERVKASSKE